MAKKKPRNKKTNTPEKILPNYSGRNTPQKELKGIDKVSERPFQRSLEYCHWEHRGWNDVTLSSFANRIIKKLKDCEGQTWHEIETASGGKTHGSNSHFISGDKLPKQEKKYFMEQGYMRNFEKVFSFRLSGKERLIGFRDKAIFVVLWYDPCHEFFPSTR